VLQDAALNNAIRTHYTQWRSYAHKLTGDRVRADDLLSETLLKLLENQRLKAQQLAVEGTLVYYVNRALFFMAIDKTSRYGTKYKRYTVNWCDTIPVDEIEPDVPWLGARIDNEYIDAYIALMPEIEAIMLRLYAMPDFSYAHVSESTGIPIKDLYKIVEIAINKIRKNANTKRTTDRTHDASTALL